MKKAYKLSLAGMLVAIGVVAAALNLSIPVGASKCFPVQHVINLLAAVILGPFYGVCMAFIASAIRVLMGTGTLNAFPGSMIGALLCGLVYKGLKNTKLTFNARLAFTLLGELIGTGFLGALAAYPVTTFIIGTSIPFFYFVIPFGISSLGGVIIAALVLVPLGRMSFFSRLTAEREQKMFGKVRDTKEILHASSPERE
ncbi:MAG: energy coupling factor transporter S component ThiW [Clostridiaceae bacterium]|jgi:energy coupling factor transporter S component ThiW|nr:energy coupling factor transporter S component ThiW [Clostridiaceae bacterium]